MRISDWSSDVCSSDLMDVAPSESKKEQETFSEPRKTESPWRFVHLRYHARPEPTVEHVSAPPQRAELVLRFALPKDQREYLIGDLEEEFRSEMVPKFGYRIAARWYWVQVLKAVAAAFGARLRVWLGISALTSAVGWLVGKMGL